MYNIGDKVEVAITTLEHQGVNSNMSFTAVAEISNNENIDGSGLKIAQNYTTYNFEIM